MRIGLFGGRFDPPHNGHLLLAEEARESVALDEVWFVPSADPPHKEAEASAEERAAMTALATEEHPAFRMCDLELRRPGPSYAFDTVEEVARDRPDAELHYLIGADAYAEIAGWHRAETLVRRVAMIVLPRPHLAPPAPPEPFRSAGRYLDAVPFGVSGTLVRRRAQQARSLRYLVPEAVVRHLRERGLYGSGGR